MRFQKFLLFGLMFLAIGNLFAQSETAKSERGKNLVKLAREKLFKETKPENVKSLQISLTEEILIESTNQVEGKSDLKRSRRDFIENEISLGLPNNVKTVSVIYGKVNPAENFTKLESVFDGTDFSNFTDTVSNGRKLDLSALIASLPSSVPDSVKKQTSSILNQKPEKNIYLEDLWVNIFPRLLAFPWDSSIEYIYVGKAQSGDIKADVVELKSAFKSNIKLFFDEKTNLLLMMTVQKGEGEKKSETNTYYFSNYELTNGILTAKKISIRGSSIDKNRREIEGLPATLSSETKTIGEVTVKDLKVNPTFKPDFFAVKK